MKLKRFALLLVVSLATLSWLAIQTSHLKFGSRAVTDAAYAATTPDSNRSLAPTTITVADTACTSIQSAIDGLPPAGGRVLVAAGLYTCDTAIVIARDNVELLGEGGSTILRLADGANAPVLVVGETSTPPPAMHHHIRVADLMIDGNRREQNHECWGGPCDQGGLSYVRNNGVTLRHVRDVVIERVTVTGARSGGLVTEKVSQRITVRDFTATDNEFDGLAGYQTEDSLFTGLHLHDNVYTGLSLDLDFNGNVVSNAIITDSGRHGIFMRDARNNVFDSLTIRTSGRQGVYLAQNESSINPAKGNIFNGLVIEGSDDVALEVADASCTDNLLVAAQLVGNLGCVREPVPGLLTQAGTLCRSMSGRLPVIIR